MFLYLETCFLRVTVSLLCRSQAVSKIHVPIYPSLISVGSEIVQTCDRHSNETLTLRKHVTNLIIKTFENGRFNISQNLRVVAINLLELNQFALSNLSIYFDFQRCVGPL